MRGGDEWKRKGVRSKWLLLTCHSLRVSLPHSFPVLQANKAVPREAIDAVVDSSNTKRVQNRFWTGSLKDMQRRRNAYENKSLNGIDREGLPDGKISLSFQEILKLTPAAYIHISHKATWSDRPAMVANLLMWHPYYANPPGMAGLDIEAVCGLLPLSS